MNIHDSLPLIKYQLGLLWSKGYVTVFLVEPLQSALEEAANDESNSDKKANNNKNIFGYVYLIRSGNTISTYFE